MSAADALLIFHFAYVLAVILPVPIVLVGGLLGWRFIRNSWFRNIHLAMIGVVVLESLAGIVCPLTTWEDRLRELSGKQPYGRSFVSYWVARLLYYDLEPWVFGIIYTAFFGLVITLYFVFPPIWLEKRRRRDG